MLTQVLEELDHRRTGRAQELHKTVARRLLEIGGTRASANAGQTAGSQSTARNAQLEAELQNKAAEVRDLRARSERAEARVTQLESALQSKATELKDLKARCERAEAASKRASDPMAILHAQVWLTPDCPAFVLDAVRRAIRKENHPDSAPPAEKTRATREFQKFETIFDQIYKARK